MPKVKMITQQKAKAGPALKKPGASRPTKYSEDLTNQIVNRMINGESMVAICRDESMPARSTVYEWLDANADFRTRCARAREGLADYLVDQIEQMANDTDEDNYQSMKVKISTAQWRAMKMAPKIYGDRSRTEITGADGGPVAFAAVDLRNLSDAELENMNLLMSKASGSKT
jgi:transposase-like protein